MKQNINNKRQYYKILFLIIFLGTLFRLYGITNPLTDSQHQRQTSTAMATRNLFEDGINIKNILNPHFDHLGNMDAVMRLEFPILNTLTAFLYHVFGVNEIIGRLVAVAFSVASMFLMFQLALKFLPYSAAILATCVYVFSPINIYFSRAFMPDSIMLFFMVGAIYFLLEYLEKEKLILYFWTIFFTLMCFLAKSPSLILLLPLGCAAFIKHKGKMFLRWDIYFFLILTIAPAAIWVLYGQKVDTIATTESQTSIIFEFLRFQFLNLGYWIRIIINISIFLLTPIGIVFFLGGIVATRSHPYRWILYIWIIMVFMFYFLYTGKNAFHLHYHLLLLPAASLLIGFSISYMIEKRYPILSFITQSKLSRYGTIFFIAVILVGYGAFYYKYFEYMYDTKLRVPYHIEAASFVRENTPEHAIIILNDPPNAVNTTFTYFSHRKTGKFKIPQGRQAINKLEQLKKQGADFYVALESKYGNGVRETKNNKDFWEYLIKYYKPLILSEQYIVFDLTVNKKDENN